MDQTNIRISVGPSPGSPSVTITEQDTPQLSAASSLSIQETAVATQGPKGDTGPQGPIGSSDVYYTAGTTLSGHRAVKISSGQAVYASSDSVYDANEFLGITTGATSGGATATIRTYGVMDEPSWSWNTSLPIFLGPNGVLTQSVPTSGFLLIIAKALLPTEIFIEPQVPIIL